MDDRRRRYKPLGLVVNPKLRLPVMVVRWSRKKPVLDDSIHIYRPIYHEQHWLRSGDGYLDEDDDVAQETDCPRSHVGRVYPRGEGYGTALYTALVLHSYRVGEGCISSEESGRSQEASQWWASAQRSGLTERFDDSSYSTGASLYDWSDATRHGLIIATFERPRTVALIDGDQWAQLPLGHILVGESILPAVDGTPVLTSARSSRKAIAALDVRGLSEDTISLLVLCMRAGMRPLSEDQEALVTRWQSGTDPDAPLHPNAPREILEANERAAELREELGWDRLAHVP
jgi:hypothetical protein